MDYLIQQLQQEIQKEQTKILEEIRKKQDEPNEVKKLDKKLDAISLFTNALIKFKRSF